MAKRKKRRRHPPPAARAGRAPRVEPSRDAARRWSTLRVGLLAAVVAAAAVAAAAIALTRESNHSATTTTSSATTPTRVSTAALPRGPVPARRLFAVYCGACHALADAGAVGTDGPDLDRLRPTKARVLAAIRRGGLGSGEMPAGIFRGRKAARVAAYVARATRGR